MSKPRRIRFVALGDSLTVGFTPFDFQDPQPDFPYTLFLDDMLSMDESSNVSASFLNRGLNGDTTSGMLRRFGTIATRDEPDYVIVWGGINDLYTGREPAEVFGNLEKICAEAREKGIDPIACTLTPVRDFPILVSKIIDLNNSIRSKTAEANILVADLYKATSDSSGNLLQKFSSDGVHLSKQGYEKVAQTIYAETIRPILKGVHS
jgi:lysophospholipase L1-like esterase